MSSIKEANKGISKAEERMFKMALGIKSLNFLSIKPEINAAEQTETVITGLKTFFIFCFSDPKIGGD